MGGTTAAAQALTLVVEAIDAVDAGALVVAAQEEEVLGVFDLVGEQEADGLQRLLAPVHIVAQEQVVTLRGEAPVLKKPQQVVVLPVNVTWSGVDRVCVRPQLPIYIPGEARGHAGTPSWSLRPSWGVTQAVPSHRRS